MKKKIATILTTALILSMIPVNVYAEDVSGNEIPEITEPVSETPEAVVENPETEVTETAEPVMIQEPEDIPEVSLGGTPVTSDEVEVLTEEEIAETLSGANNTSADFIERLYNVALDRPSEEAGKQDWLNRLNEGSTGADLAKGFLYSQEFLNKGTSNDQFLTVLYKTFFDREPDEAGKAGWMKALNEGTSRQQIVDGFIGSQEYSNLCATYGISAGTGVVPNIEIEPNEDTKAFVRRLYTTCLDREADAEGLNNWSKALANQRVSGTEVAEGFFFSQELNNTHGISPRMYITKLYRAFFDRDPDEAGLLNWENLLVNGPRKNVFNGFAMSEEWKKTCARYGIVCGYPEGTENNPAANGCVHYWVHGPAANGGGFYSGNDEVRDSEGNMIKPPTGHYDFIRKDICAKCGMETAPYYSNKY